MTDKDSETVSYYIYEHSDSDSCNSGSMYNNVSGRAVRTGREAFDEDTEPPCDEIRCDTNLQHDRTVEIDNTLPEVSESDAERISELSDYERTLLLGMTMESIRGNWEVLEKRLGIIGKICELGVGDHLSDEFINAVETYAKRLWRKRRVDHLYPDGRLFRGEGIGRYGKLWDEVDKHVGTMESLAPMIPNDMTWDYYRFEKIRKNEKV